MKAKVIVVFVSLLVLFACTPAYGADSDGTDNSSIPDEILAVLSDDAWSGYSPVMPTWYQVGNDYGLGSFYPVILGNGVDNILCVFSKEHDSWVAAFSNEHALLKTGQIPDTLNYNVFSINDSRDGIYAQMFTVSYQMPPHASGISEIHFHYENIDHVWVFRLAQIFYVPITQKNDSRLLVRETNIVQNGETLERHDITNEKLDGTYLLAKLERTITLENIDVTDLLKAYFQ